MKNELQEITVQSPGRINLIGEHTDYNDGFVLPAAIDKKMVLHLKKNNTLTSCKITADNVGESYNFDLSKLKPLEKGGWENYVMGVVSELQKLGATIAGFDAAFSGDVPIGSGMSSSAALECSFAFGLNELFDLGFDRWQMIKASQLAEHNFTGNLCGIMDQFASMMGKKNQVMLLDCASLEFEYFPLELEQYEIVLLNTNVSHSLADSAYNARRKSCEAGMEIIQAHYPSIKNFREVDLEMLNSLKGKLSEEIYNRCHHVITENARVQTATKALLAKDFKKFGELIYASHASLQKEYEVSCDELDFLVEETKAKNYVIGARMMGGGFGGCTLNLVEKKNSDEFISEMAKAYLGKFDKELSPYRVSVEDGSSIVKS